MSYFVIKDNLYGGYVSSDKPNKSPLDEAIRLHDEKSAKEIAKWYMFSSYWHLSLDEIDKEKYVEIIEVSE